MAKENGKSLVIVESPAKAKTISKFLGKNFTVEASVGHVRDLPEGKKQVPAKYKNETWGKYGVNVNEGFEPIYIVLPGKKEQISKLKNMLKDADALYLATDEDREGEAISWHLLELLKPKVPVHRLVFHEITQQAIQDALNNTRDINDDLVRAQETRRILDRLYGYGLTPLLGNKVKWKASAGRVQSVAVRLIVERERERCRFRSATYWDLMGKFTGGEKVEFQAGLVSCDGKKVPNAKHFDPETGKPLTDEILLLDSAGAKALADKLKTETFTVTAITEKPRTEKPSAPFITTSMQKAASRLGFNAQRTMSIAQSLYENGYITYMRTDSTTLAEVALTAARTLVETQYGKEYLPDQPRLYASKSKNAQEAHEAIRPALSEEGGHFRLPSEVRGELSDDQFKLYDLIWKQTVKSQMNDAKKKLVTVTIEGGGAVFQVSGSTIEFPGFLRADVEGAADPIAALSAKEKALPPLTKDQVTPVVDLETVEHKTSPPSRYSEPALISALEDRGIGRPSTYASIIQTIIKRDYVFKKGSALVPTWLAFSVTRLLEDHLPMLVDYDFTAQMEEFLDEVSRGEQDYLQYLTDFFHGNNPGVEKQVALKIDEVDREELNKFLIGTPEEGPHREPIYVHYGTKGPYIQQGSRKVPSLPLDLPPDELTIAKAMEMLDRVESSNTPIGKDSESGENVYLKYGPHGPYVQLGENPTDPDAPKPKRASLLNDMSPDDLDLPTAVKLLSLPRTLGDHPEEKLPIQAAVGRHGPYVMMKEGDKLKDTRSLPKEISPLEVTLEQAIELFKQPKQRRGRAAPKEPLKTFKESPVTGNVIKLLDGRFGPYVTDGETLASVPKGTTIEEVTHDQAVELLAERAAAAPTKKKRKKSAKAATKKATKKKKASKKKKAAKKKS